MKTDKTKRIEKALCREFRRQYGCLEVSIGIGSRIKERVDFMVFDHYRGVFRCFEIKVSKSDFHSSAAKSFVGHYNYYVLPYELYCEVAAEIPTEIGVYTVSSNGFLSCEEKAKKQNLSPEEVEILKDSLIRSLSRDANKLYQSDDEDMLQAYKRTCASMERKANSLYSENITLALENSTMKRVLVDLFGRDYVDGILS